MAEAQTLTYDPSEQKEGELSTEEQEALKVGEQLAEQQEQLLAGKFKDAEELEKGYIELQKKLGESKEETTEPEQPEAKEEPKEKEEEKEIDTALLDSLWEEGVKGEYSKETLQKLANTDSREVAQMYLKYRSENQKEEQTSLSEDNITQLKGVVGGEGEYDKMMKWAGESLQEDEVKMYDAVMDKGDPLAAFFAVQALTYRYNDSKGVDGQMLQGKAPVEKGDAFRSQAEVVRAMNDPRYDKDPAYRQDIYDKLERSNLNF
tara:strand:+ start:648 stop:1433 length:786 start_codon:yes stop_codon:yes gene_type:complete